MTTGTKTIDDELITRIKVDMTSAASLPFHRIHTIDFRDTQKFFIYFDEDVELTLDQMFRILKVLDNYDGHFKKLRIRGGVFIFYYED